MRPRASRSSRYGRYRQEFASLDPPCEIPPIAPHQERPNLMRESSHFFHVRLAVERNGNVETLGPGGLHPAWKAKFVEQIANRKSRGAQHACIVDRRIEVEHTDIRVV